MISSQTFGTIRMQIFWSVFEGAREQEPRCFEQSTKYVDLSLHGAISRSSGASCLKTVQNGICF